MTGMHIHSNCRERATDVSLFSVRILKLLLRSDICVISVLRRCSLLIVAVSRWVVALLLLQLRSLSLGCQMWCQLHRHPRKMMSSRPTSQLRGISSSAS